ncbi:MAG: amidohydrolase family protein [Dehalococcoidia bacterium]|nr:amidohydrolase family protein [Dehalococcoidia bacterium]
MKGIPAIDCHLTASIPGTKITYRQGQRDPHVATMIQEGWLRDDDSVKYAHPAQHFFKGSDERMKKGTTIEELIAVMDEVGIEKGMTPIALDNPRPVLKILNKYPDRFNAYVNVNPWLGMPELRAMESLVKSHPQVKACAVAGFRIQKPYNDKIYWPLYARCCDLDIPVLCYVGLPGPRVPGELQNPMYLDEVLWFFPELKVVMKHGGEPWEFECVKLMLKWPNLYYMTSAFAPRHYPKDIIHYANTRGSSKVLYAGYWPGLDVRRVAKELENDVTLRDEVWPLFLRENAIRVFKL